MSEQKMSECMCELRHRWQVGAENADDFKKWPCARQAYTPDEGGDVARYK